MLAQAYDYSDDMGEIELATARDVLLEIAKSTCNSLDIGCYLGSPYEVNGDRYILVCKVYPSGKYYAEANLSRTIEYKNQSYEDFANEEPAYVFTDSELK